MNCYFSIYGNRKTLPKRVVIWIQIKLRKRSPGICFPRLIFCNPLVFMETLVLALLLGLIGLALFVGISIRNHAKEVERNLRSYTTVPAEKEPT